MILLVGEELRVLAKFGEAMKANKTNKTQWPPGKPLPGFATRAEEDRFWLTHDFDAAMDADGEAVTSKPQAPPRSK